jgi:hypothetical protein
MVVMPVVAVELLTLVKDIVVFSCCDAGEKLIERVDG